MNINELPKKTPVITTKYITEKISPIVYISYEIDGDFQIFSDEGAEMENAKVISLGEILKLDESVLLLTDINKGEKFFRQNADEQWQKI